MRATACYAFHKSCDCVWANKMSLNNKQMNYMSFDYRRNSSADDETRSLNST